jgi:hypothetical protein
VDKTSRRWHEGSRRASRKRSRDKVSFTSGEWVSDERETVSNLVSCILLQVRSTTR